MAVFYEIGVGDKTTFETDHYKIAEREFDRLKQTSAMLKRQVRVPLKMFADGQVVKIGEAKS